MDTEMIAKTERWKNHRIQNYLLPEAGFFKALQGVNHHTLTTTLTTKHFFKQQDPGIKR